MKIELFYPYVPKSVVGAIKKTLSTKWIGQGPKVLEFENLWEEKISFSHKAIAVGSGTNALHLAYILAGIREGDEVIAPIFTYPATNIPLLYQKAKIVFADIKKDSLNIDPSDIRRKITSRTKAIVVVHYGGVPCDMDEIQAIADEYHIPIIEDAAYAIGATYKGKNIGSLSDFTCFSFQAVKMITTGAGGMLTIKNPKIVSWAKKLRLFGMEKTSKLEDRWAKDITEVGYRYEMTDIAATMGIEALKKFSSTLKHYQDLAKIYSEELKNIPSIQYIGGDSLCVILVEKREDLEQKLAIHGIESSQVDYRNDRYSIFGGRVENCPNMDMLEKKYLVLPMHHHLQKKDIQYICQVIKK